MSTLQTQGAAPPHSGRANPSMRDHFRFYSRYAWVGLKRVAGLRLTSDNRHMCERIVRGARAGRIAPGTVLAVEIRRDGFGSQVLSRLSVEATARDLGLAYAHRPFVAIAHAEGDADEWVRRCEETFALGVGRKTLADFNLPMVDLTRYATNRSLWARPHIVTMNNMHIHCDRNPEIYRAVVPMRVETTPRNSRTLRIAVHVRRGDVSTQKVSHRFTPNQIVLSTVRRVVELAEKQGLSSEVTVYSNGKPSEFADFADLGYRVDVELGALDVFERLRESDVLLTAKSTFSYVAGLYARGIVLYEPFARRPLESWIPRQADGGFSEAALAERLATLMP
jgi:hypothetical protein